MEFKNSQVKRFSGHEDDYHRWKSNFKSMVMLSDLRVAFDVGAWTKLDKEKTREINLKLYHHLILTLDKHTIQKIEGSNIEDDGQAAF